MDFTLPGSFVHRILQARILEWIAISSSRRSSWPRDGTHVSFISCIGRHVLYCWAIREAPMRDDFWLKAYQHLSHAEGFSPEFTIVCGYVWLLAKSLPTLCAEVRLLLHVWSHVYNDSWFIAKAWATLMAKVQLSSWVGPLMTKEGWFLVKDKPTISTTSYIKSWDFYPL